MHQYFNYNNKSEMNNLSKNRSLPINSIAISKIIMRVVEGCRSIVTNKVAISDY